MADGFGLVLYETLRHFHFLFLYQVVSTTDSRMYLFIFVSMDVLRKPVCVSTIFLYK